jgi:hypothetical protein
MFTRGPLPEEVKHRPVYTLIFSALRFILPEWVSERGHPPRHEARMDFFVPFVFSLVFGLMRFDRIGSFGTNKFNDPTLLSLKKKLLNLVVKKGASWTMRAKSMGICG